MNISYFSINLIIIESIDIPKSFQKEQNFFFIKRHKLFSILDRIYKKKEKKKKTPFDDSYQHNAIRDQIRRYKTDDLLP